MNDQRQLRKDLLELLGGGSAHVKFDKALRGLPFKLQGARPPDQPHTPWRLLEHMRLAQRDILEFVRNPRHVSPDWPEGYWPTGDGPRTAAKEWQKSSRAFLADLKAMQELVKKSADLLAPIAHGDGQTIAREAMLLADHNAYHLGQLVIVRRMLGAWKD